MTYVSIPDALSSTFRPVSNHSFPRASHQPVTACRNSCTRFLGLTEDVQCLLQAARFESLSHIKTLVPLFSAGNLKLTCRKALCTMVRMPGPMYHLWQQMQPYSRFQLCPTVWLERNQSPQVRNHRRQPATTRYPHQRTSQSTLCQDLTPPCHRSARQPVLRLSHK